MDQLEQNWQTCGAQAQAEPVLAVAQGLRGRYQCVRWEVRAVAEAVPLERDPAQAGAEPAVLTAGVGAGAEASHPLEAASSGLIPGQ